MIGRNVLDTMAKRSNRFFIVLLLVFMLAACSAENSAPRAETVAETVSSEGQNTPAGPTQAPPPSPTETHESQQQPQETAEPEAGPTTTPQPDAAPAEAPGGTLAIHNGLLITATGDEPIPDGVVVIKDGLITAAGGSNEVTIPDDAIDVDAGGGAILPGLIDAHTHLLNEITVADGEVDPLSVGIYLTLPLKSGVTTIRDLGSDFGSSRDVGELRKALDKLGNTVPTIILTGPILAAPGSWVHGQFGNQAVVVQDATAAGEQTKRLLAAGVDQIKLLSDPQNGDPAESLTAEQVQAVVEAAHAAGAQVTIHAGVTDAETAVAEGIDELAHWPLSPDGPNKPVVLPDELFNALIANDIPIVGTLNLSKAAERDVRRFLDAGGTLIYGTDGPGTGSIADPYREINTMALNDVSPMEIIQAATANAAAALGLGDTLGTLEVGRTADIIVLGGNPLEDLRVFRDGPTVVIKGGELVPLDS